jgi:DNA-binding transcriptional ArsR family regulator
MNEGPDITRIAALIGERSRANMLMALLGGRALTASELAAEAGITAQTASGHLLKLEEGGLLRPRRQGRHKYFSLMSAEVAETLEALMGLAARSGHLRSRPGPRDKALRQARLCYNHLAGELGVRMFDSLVSRGCLVFRDGDLALTEAGRAFAADLGIDVEPLKQQRTALCRECLDWSERRSHLAGSLGRALLTRFIELDWARADRATRIVRFTAHGAHRFQELFGSPTPAD